MNKKYAFLVNIGLMVPAILLSGYFTFRIFDPPKTLYKEPTGLWLKVMVSEFILSNLKNNQYFQLSELNCDTCLSISGLKIIDMDDPQMDDPQDEQEKKESWRWIKFESNSKLNDHIILKKFADKNFLMAYSDTEQIVIGIKTKNHAPQKIIISY